MDIGGTQSCTTCGSSKGFEEISGLYYCLTCNTQRVGFTLEVRQYDESDWNLKQLAFDDRNKKTRKKKTFNPGEAWTIIEAFNIILNHQCSQLEKGLKLGPQFRVILFNLWSEYLAKGELAFTGKTEEEPKSHINTSYRDLQIIGEGRQNVEQLPAKSQKKLKEKAYCGFIRLKRLTLMEYGEKRLAQFHDMSSSDELNKEDGDKERNRDDYGEAVDGLEETSKSDINCTQDENCDLDDVPIVEWTEDMQDNFLYNYSYNIPALEDFENLDDYEPDISGTSSDSTDSTDSSRQFSAYATKATSSVFTDEKHVDINGLRPADPIFRPWVYHKLKQKARKFCERFDNGTDFDSLIQELEDDEETEEDIEKEPAENRKLIKNDADEMGGTNTNTKTKEVELTKRSQLLKKLIGDTEKNKKILYHANYLTMERMTMQRTLQFILLAFRIAGYNVHVGDIIHWVFMGHLTYFGAVDVLPDKWIFVSNNDIIHLQPKRNVNVSQLDYQTADLRRFLAIPTLPHPDFIEVITRHLYDLNLPLRFVDLINDKIDWSSFDQLFERYSAARNSKYIPCYEIFSICSIIVILQNIFSFDGHTETVISKNIREKWPESFIWEDWYNDNRVIWKLMNRHYFPLNTDLYNEISDTETIRCHRDKISSNWFGLSVKHRQRFYFLTKEFKADFAKAMEDAFEVDPCTIDPPPLTVYHLYEAKKFIAKRINQIRSSSSSSSSSSQSMDIFASDYTNKSIDYLFDVSFIRYKANSLPEGTSNLDELPESIRLLIKLSSFITNRSPDKIIWFLSQLGEHFSC